MKIGDFIGKIITPLMIQELNQEHNQLTMDSMFHSMEIKSLILYSKNFGYIKKVLENEVINNFGKFLRIAIYYLYKEPYFDDLLTLFFSKYPSANFLYFTGNGFENLATKLLFSNITLTNIQHLNNIISQTQTDEKYIWNLCYDAFNQDYTTCLININVFTKLKYVPKFEILNLFKIQSSIFEYHQDLSCENSRATQKQYQEPKVVINVDKYNIFFENMQRMFSNINKSFWSPNIFRNFYDGGISQYLQRHLFLVNSIQLESLERFLSMVTQAFIRYETKFEKDYSDIVNSIPLDTTSRIHPYFKKKFKLLLKRSVIALLKRKYFQLSWPQKRIIFIAVHKENNKTFSLLPKEIVSYILSFDLSHPNNRKS